MSGNLRPYQNFEEGKHLIGKIVKYKNALVPSLKIITEVHNKGAVIGQIFYTYEELFENFVLPEKGFEHIIGKLINF